MRHHLTLTPKREAKVRTALTTIPCGTHQVSLRKWRHLLGILQIINPSVTGARGMFTHLQNALENAICWRVPLYSEVHDNTKSWLCLIRDLASRPTHLRELYPTPHT